MRRAVLLCGTASFLMAFLGGFLAFNLAVPSLVEAQDARIRGQQVTGPGVRANMSLLDPNGTPRISLNNGGEAGTNPIGVGIILNDTNDIEIARLGTGNGGTAGRVILRLSDQAENPRILLTV